ncbi:MAG: tRNA 2-thiouridine(34) synthase TusC [Moraxellaceae bacterium]|jgi:tRNA 2-thiouridine synthesizing protein C|nr:tRNA 2-thiouridine(34) synthase TusC [Moraxellaceae bacterium]
MKRVLFIQHRAPYGSESPQEQIDAQLVAATFGLRVSVLFQDDGVWQLLSQQDGKALERRTLGAQLQALELYEISDFYADAAALDERGLEPGQLSLPVRVLDAAALKTLIAEHDLVLRF